MKTVNVDNLRDAVNKTISFENANGKKYQHDEKTAVLMVRPRGWHLEEKHVLLDGNPISGSLFDFAMHFFHNAKKLVQQAQAHTSTFLRWRATLKRAFGTMCSFMHRIILAFHRERLKQLF